MVRKKKPDSRPLMNEMAEHLGGECYVCGESYYNKRGKPRTQKRWVVHHLWYAKDDLRYINFKGQFEYWTVLLPQVKERGKDGFLLLCGKHHQTVENLAYWNGWKFRRLLRAVERTVSSEPYGKKDAALGKEKKKREEQEWTLQLRDVR